MKTVKKLKRELPHDSSIPLDVFPKEMKSVSLSDIWTLMFTAVLLQEPKYGVNLNVPHQMNG
jgi:hypothetical protein